MLVRGARMAGRRGRQALLARRGKVPGLPRRGVRGRPRRADGRHGDERAGEHARDDESRGADAQALLSRPDHVGSTTLRNLSILIFLTTCFFPDGHMTVSFWTAVCWPSPNRTASWLPEAT